MPIIKEERFCFCSLLDLADDPFTVDEMIETSKSGDDLSLQSESPSSAPKSFVSLSVEKSRSVSVLSSPELEARHSVGAAVASHLGEINRMMEDLVRLEREKEVPLEPFISNPFLMNVCHLRSLLNFLFDKFFKN